MSPGAPLICHIVYRLAVGGLENGLVNLVNNLPEERYRHAIVCITAATDFRQRIRRAGISVHELHKRPGKDIAVYGRMRRLLRELQPRIVHTRNLPALDMIVPARLAGVRRFIHSEHGLDSLEIDGKNRKYNRLRQLSRLFVDRYITVSRDLNTWLRRDIGVPESRLETIYNGVDTDRFSPAGEGRSALPLGFAPNGSIVLGTFGRLDATKNQVLLARAFGRAIARRPALRDRLRLVIVGEGDRRPEIEAALDHAGIRDLAWLPGFRDDMPSLYRALDIFVLPSLREGISNTLLEAMATARPVIATRVGGNPEIVPDGVVGRLVSPTDVDALAAAILFYVDDPALLRAHGEAAREHTLRRFALHAMVQNYDRSYGSLL
jgi:sugar transferase (PEP-CTERM/EpsH1 system associated)